MSLQEAYLLSYVRECDLSSAAAEENAVPYVGDIIQVGRSFHLLPPSRANAELSRRSQYPDPLQI